MNAAATPLFLIGHGPEFRNGVDEWREAQPAREIAVVEIEPDDVYADRYLPLYEFPSDRWVAFGMLPPAGLNMARAKLMLDLKLAGYRLDAFASPHAILPASWKLPEHSFVSAGAQIDHGVRAGFNLFVEGGARVRRGASLGRSVFVAASACVGFDAEIGDNTLIGGSVVVGPGVRVGRQCELLVARTYTRAIDDRTFFSPQFEDAVRVYSG